MWARRLIYTLLATLPVMFTAAIAVGTRLTPMDWTTPEFGDKTNKALLAYAPLVKRTLHDVPASMHPDADKLEAVTGAWLDADLPPLSTGMTPASGLEGPFYDVQRARQLVCMNLLRVACRSADDGDGVKAAHFASLALQVAEVAKYSSLNSIGTATDVQREVIRTIGKGLGDLDDKSLAELNLALGKVTARPDVVMTCADNLLEATREVEATAKSLKRYASTEMSPVSLKAGSKLPVTPDMTTDELTIVSLADASYAATNELGASRAELLRKLAPKG